jgi:hypothetical protein
VVPVAKSATTREAAQSQGHLHKVTAPTMSEVIMVRARSIATLAAAGAAAFPAVVAADPPEREVFLGGGSFETSVPCGFVVRVAESSDTRIVERTWRYADGTVRVLSTAPRIVQTLTNVATGRQVVISGGGAAQERVTHPDGSSEFSSAGKTVWGLRNPVTGELGFFLITGRLEADRGPGGVWERFEVVGGTLERLCPALA